MPILIAVASIAPVGVSVFGTIAFGSSSLLWVIGLVMVALWLPRSWRPHASGSAILLLAIPLVSAAEDTRRISQWLRLPVDARAVRQPLGRSKTQFWRLEDGHSRLDLSIDQMPPLDPASKLGPGMDTRWLIAEMPEPPRADIR